MPGGENKSEMDCMSFLSCTSVDFINFLLILVSSKQSWLKMSTSLFWAKLLLGFQPSQFPLPSSFPIGPEWVTPLHDGNYRLLLSENALSLCVFSLLHSVALRGGGEGVCVCVGDALSWTTEAPPGGLEKKNNA